MARKRSQSELPGADELYARLIAEQDGRCAVNGCTRTPKTRRFHIDHDHKTGRVRGLLCHWHNRIMPRDGDEARAMADYLDASLRNDERGAVERGLTCPRCRNLCPWDSVVCVECGSRLGVQVA